MALVLGVRQIPSPDDELHISVIEFPNGVPVNARFPSNGPRCPLLFLLIAMAWIESGWGQGPPPETVSLAAQDVDTLVAELNGGTGGLALDLQGNLFSGDFGWRLDGRGKGGHQIFKVRPTGEHSVYSTSMRGASGNTVDAKGNLYQSSIGGNFVTRITPDGQSSVYCKQGLTNPVGLAFDDQGNLFVCNCGSGSIQKVSPDGQSVQYCKDELLKCPNGITHADDGNLYVACFMSGDVVKITPEGVASRLATLPGNNNGHITYYGGYLYVVARTANQIYRVGLDGKTRLFVGSGKRGKTDGKPLECSLSLPNDLAITPDGKLMYINETGPIEGDPKVLGPTRIRRVSMTREESPQSRAQPGGTDGQKAVTIDDFGWIAGRWAGEAMGGQFEENWNPPSGGTMMGMFKFINDKGVGFYEFLTIVPSGQSYLLRLKHFHADLKGWEEKDESIEFPLVQVTPTQAIFDGLRFEKIDDDRMKVVVNIKRDGDSQEVVFDCVRADSR